MLKPIPYSSLSLNPMTAIAESWWLVTAGNQNDGFNTMTASWGHLGSLWGKPSRKVQGQGLPTTICYVRPQRYTKQFMDRFDTYTLSFFDSNYQKELRYLGSHSGKDENKVEAVGFHPFFVDGTTSFEEAKLVFVCKKIYQTPLLESGFKDTEVLDATYPKRDFHDLYIGEILSVYSQD